MIQNKSKDAALSSYDKLKINADGSIDLCFRWLEPAHHATVMRTRKTSAWFARVCTCAISGSQMC
jgi:hypothetical protein